MNRSRKAPASGWELAARLCENLSTTREKAGTALDRYATLLSSGERRHCQRLFFAAVRHQRLIEHTLAHLIARQPRSTLRGMLTVALGELFESAPDRSPLVVDFWVGKIRENLSRPEAGLANAVLRKASALRDDIARSGKIAILHSHPDWLVERWLNAYGPVTTLTLLEYNQQPAEVFLRLRHRQAPIPPGCEPSPWPNFLRWTGNGDWSTIQILLDAGTLYAQDPGTRLAPALINARSGERILDLCAAPGGKTLLMADSMKEGEILAVDAPGPRLSQLQENLAKLSTYPNLKYKLLAADGRTLDPQHLGLFDGILLDAPCSNTGVLRRRPDAKWRLTPESISELTQLQGELLQSASRLLAPHGRLVYSTCSIEPEENQGVVNAFLNRNPDFRLLHGETSLPSTTGHDGAGTFLLTRQAST